MEQQGLIPHLFRSEYRKIVAVLCKRFGFDQIGMAEDIASDTFLTALQTWPMTGLPPEPTAWLYSVARNKANTLLQRENTFRQKIKPALKHDNAKGMEGEEGTTGDIDLSPENIKDSQLQMIFALAHASLPEDAQVGLALRILCGFGIDEIADAFLTNKDTINKRLFRAREKLRQEGIRMEMPGPAVIGEKLKMVLRTIYLLFNEGYYSLSSNEIIRKDLCMEAMRLCHMLVEYKPTDTPQTNALLALMCFHASRFEARMGRSGEIILYEDQDERLWDQELIMQGAYFLQRSASGEVLSSYHLEASIAYWSTQKNDTPEKWEEILSLYNLLLRAYYSPIAALNRTYALAKARGRETAIREAEKLGLADNPFYFALLGELYSGMDDAKAAAHFQAALELARTQPDKDVIAKKLAGLSCRGN